MASPVWRSYCCQLLKTLKISSLNSSKSQFSIPVAKRCLVEISRRGMASGGPRTMTIRPSRYAWTRFKNDLHFYLMLGGLPLGAVILYANFIIGESELAEIPEGYEPKHWEYHKHPICRWFARYIYDDPVKIYEMEAAKHVYHFEAQRNRAHIVRVKEMMKKHEDFRSYYFLPAVDPRFTEDTRRRTEYERHYEDGDDDRTI